MSTLVGYRRGGGRRTVVGRRTGYRPAWCGWLPDPAAAILLAICAIASFQTSATAQIRTTPPPEQYVLDELLLDNDAEILGKHVARLHHAARNCGGGFDEKRVDPYGESSERLRNYRAYTIAYNAEMRHLPGYQRFRGRDATCQRLYAFYGPRGATAHHAYLPLRDQFGNRSRQQSWLKHYRHGAGL